MESEKLHSGSSDVAGLAKRFGFSSAAVEAARDALARGKGGAQFSHPELGGSVQWMGGMLQIGDMFNHDLKARVAGLMEALSASPAAHSPAPSSESKPSEKSTSSQHSDWWPKGLGKPSTVGGQNDQRYAFFPDAHRLAVEDNGRQTLYDTGSHKITGAAQGQATGEKRELAFSEGDGKVVALSDLKVVDGWV